MSFRYDVKYLLRPILVAVHLGVVHWVCSQYFYYIYRIAVSTRASDVSYCLFYITVVIYT